MEAKFNKGREALYYGLLWLIHYHMKPLCLSHCDQLASVAISHIQVVLTIVIFQNRESLGTRERFVQRVECLPRKRPIQV